MWSTNIFCQDKYFVRTILPCNVLGGEGLCRLYTQKHDTDPTSRTECARKWGEWRSSWLLLVDKCHLRCLKRRHNFSCDWETVDEVYELFFCVHARPDESSTNECFVPAISHDYKLRVHVSHSNVADKLAGEYCAIAVAEASSVFIHFSFSCVSFCCRQNVVFY